MSELVINGYKLLKPMTTDNAGFSKWGFATKDGKIYFLKQLISPTYPVNEEKYSASRLLSKREFCSKFEAEKKKIYERINQAADGNIVAIEEFFREDSHYYVVEKKIDAFEYRPVDSFSYQQRGLLCKMLARSITNLHGKGVVHGDLKVNNILFSFSMDKQNILAKIIDFDNSFLISTAPKNPDTFQIDQIYCAPETYRFIAGENILLNEKIDIFALGIIFHFIFTRDLPRIDGESKYIFEAKLNNEKVILDSSLGKELEELVDRMLSLEAHLRPSAEEVYNELLRIFDRKNPSVVEEPVEPDEPEEPDGPEEFKELEELKELEEPKSEDQLEELIKKGTIRLSGPLLRALERENQKKRNQ